MLNLHFIRRQIAGSMHQSIVFVLCVVLSMVTLISLSGFSRSVHSSFLRDARTLHAADIIIESHSPFSPGLREALATLDRQKTLVSARVFEFYSVVQTPDKKASLLSSIKVVEPGYPFYGDVELASGRLFSDVLTPGSIVAEQALLDRLQLRLGDRLRIGSTVLTIRDVVVQEPDRPVNFFALGPRIFISASDLSALELVGKGSRVNYTILAKVRDEKDLDDTAARLRAASLRDRESIETYRTAASGVKRFFDNFLFFLNLIGIFTLLLAGIGIQSSLAAFLNEQKHTIAVMKAVGARGRFILTHYFAMVSVLGLVGTVLGLAVSFFLEKILRDLFRGLVPDNVSLTIPASAVIEGLVLGFLVVFVFTFLPLYRLRDVKPRAIFAKEEQSAAWGRAAWVTVLASLIFFFALLLWRTREVKSGFVYVLVLGSLILAVYLCAAGLLRAVRILGAKNLIVRQAMKGLLRPGNATRTIIVTLAASLTVIVSIIIIERNLNETFVRSYPPDSPNVFFVDIQPGQKAALAKDLEGSPTFYPVIQGTILAVNGKPIDREQEQRRRGDNLAREFSLTYQEHLLEDERLIAGKTLFREDWTELQVSVLDTVLDMKEMKVGDVITFRIQGVPVEARISSVRTRTHSSLRPFFYFVFREQAIKDAPHTFFTALRVDKEKIASLQNRIVARFPNVSVIDVTETVKIFARLMERLSAIVRFFTLFSSIAGMLIIVSSVFATRHARIQEAVYYTVLGARPRFVLSVFVAEGLLLGLASGLIALLLSQAGSWIVCRTVFEVPYRPILGVSLLMASAMIALVVVVGLGASAPILRRKPAAFLREQTEE